MKLQHMAIIFVIIILPISLVLSVYISTQIDAIKLQIKYDNFLISATYDGIKAFQLNSLNNEYSTVSNSKIRDIEAGIKTFFSTLNTNFMSVGTIGSDLSDLVPAVLFTLYDGYYIYSGYDDYEVYNTEDKYTYGLKPFIYYSCRYVKGSDDDFVVNYTLDNTISVIGKVNGNYVTKTGHLIDRDNVPFDSLKGLTGDALKDKMPSRDKDPNVYDTYKDGEILKEDLILLSDKFEPLHGTESKPEFHTYNYIVHNSQKIYRDDDFDVKYSDYDSSIVYPADTYIEGVSNTRYFTVYQNKKMSVNDLKLVEELNSYKETSDAISNSDMISFSAFNYYKDAMIFTDWCIENIGDITQQDAVYVGLDDEGNRVLNKIMDDESKHKFDTDTGDAKIFVTGVNNDPLLENSVFNENRICVIRYSIETNLTSAIANYNKYSDTTSGIEYAMPKFTAEDWYKIENNICIATFLEGIPIGYRLYNNYCVLSNNTNKESINENSMFCIATKSDGNKEYHKIGCKQLIEEVKDNKISFLDYYESGDFTRKSVALKGTEESAIARITHIKDENIKYYGYYYPHSDTACYNCIVNVSNTLSPKEILTGTVYNPNTKKEEYVYESGTTEDVSYKSAREKIKKLYQKAIARSRNDLYLTNGYFGSGELDINY